MSGLERSRCRLCDGISSLFLLFLLVNITSPLFLIVPSHMQTPAPTVKSTKWIKAIFPLGKTGNIMKNEHNPSYTLRRQNRNNYMDSMWSLAVHDGCLTHWNGQHLCSVTLLSFRPDSVSLGILGLRDISVSFRYDVL